MEVIELWRQREQQWEVSGCSYIKFITLSWQSHCSFLRTLVVLLELLAVSVFVVKGVIRTLGLPPDVYPRKYCPFHIVCLFILNCVKECMLMCVCLHMFVYDVN